MIQFVFSQESGPRDPGELVEVVNQFGQRRNGRIVAEHTPGVYHVKIDDATTVPVHEQGATWDAGNLPERPAPKRSKS